MIDGPNNGNGPLLGKLPTPQKLRWQPLRSGFIDIYKYDREEFHYENGRLLLRGNNGTGKSRVLALQLPFLLEGETAPHRVEPDADQAKRIEWNLLMGKYPERTGYTWIEFGRHDADGTDKYLSLGCGMNAIEGRTGVQKWFFITDQRIGVELKLENDLKQAVGRDRLQEALGARGHFFSKVHEYRQAVDHALFRLGEFRFPTLLNLLVRLRRPQLSRQFNEEELSEILSEALAPVSAGVLADVSDAFRSLESDRLELHSFLAANDAVATFLKDYRRYIQSAAYRRADRVRDRQATYENRLRQIRAEQSTEMRTRAEIEEAAAEVSLIESASTAAEAEIETLLSSPHMKDAEDLKRAGEAVQQQEKARNYAADTLGQLAESSSGAERRLQDTNNILLASKRNVDQWTDKMEDSARNALLLPDYSRAMQPLALPSIPDPAAVDGAKRAVDESADRQNRRIATVRSLNEALKKVEDRLVKSAEQEHRAQRGLDEAMELHRKRHEQLLDATNALANSYRGWAGSLQELRLSSVEELISALLLWCETLNAANPAHHAIRVAHQEAVQEIATLHAQIEQELTLTNATLSDFRKDYARLDSGRHTPPPVPYTRDVQAREGLAGAPLWLVCDFTEDLDSATRAGFEAALESAGLLDAWITPDGKLLELKAHDTILTVGLTIGANQLPPADAHLGRVLKPSVPHDESGISVPASVVDDILRHIGTDPDSSSVWVSSAGHWQVGPLNGKWMKSEAEHIGHRTRELNRKRRMAQLAAEIDLLTVAVEKMESNLNDLDVRTENARREVETMPGDEQIQTLHLQISAAYQTVTRLRNEVAEAQSQTAGVRRERDTAAQERDQTASDLGLLDCINRLQEVESAISTYRISAAELFGGIRLFLEHRSQVGIAENQQATAMERERQQASVLRQYELDLTAAISERETLQRTVGAAAEQVIKELADARKRRDELKGKQKAANEKHSRAVAKLEGVLRAIQIHQESLESETASRDQALQQFKTFAGTRLLHLAVPGLTQEGSASWSVTRGVEVAREIVASLANIDASDAAWERLQNGVTRQYSDLVQQLHSHDCRASATFCEDVFVATVSYGPEERGIEELRDWLTFEVATRQELLAAREREVLENHLIGDVADHLNKLLHEGESLVRDMNSELNSRPTSTGMKLRFTWRARDDEPDLVEARKILMRMSGTWTPAERQIAGAFLQSRIQTQRMAAEASSWQESLALALDYRKWHAFAVERQQDGRWQVLNRRTHGTGSGGEKAIALTLPQFAAAAAYYRSADKFAPRLILLDEAFVGIDTDMRGKCMGFIETFDLDFMMTSEREWGCYSTLPGVAIYQLSTRPGIDAIGLTRWVWNGNERILDGHG